MHHFIKPLFLEPVVHLVTQGHDTRREFRVLLRIHPIDGHGAEHHVLGAHGVDQLIPPIINIGAGVQIGQPRIQPIGFGAVQTVARSLRFYRRSVGHFRVP